MNCQHTWHNVKRNEEDLFYVDECVSCKALRIRIEDGTVVYQAIEYTEEGECGNACGYNGPLMPLKYSQADDPAPRCPSCCDFWELPNGPIRQDEKVMYVVYDPEFIHLMRAQEEE